MPERSPAVTRLAAAIAAGWSRPAIIAAEPNTRRATPDNTAPMPATLTRMPINRVVLASPEAIPARSSGTAPPKTFTVWPLSRPAPQPATNMAMTKTL